MQAQGDLPLPRLLVHADWSNRADKRRMAWAIRDRNSYIAHPPEPVGDLATFWLRLRRMVGAADTVLIGFDFPIGLPLAYARRAGIDDFLSALPMFGQDRWRFFYEVAEWPNQIGLSRPFYPYRPGGATQQNLVERLGVDCMRDLLRRCDRRTADRRAAAPLFWTLGPQQVGRAAIVGWREVLAPGLECWGDDLAIWPFAGELVDLRLQRRPLIVAETYPAEVYRHLGFPRGGWSKRNPSSRRQQGVRIIRWLAQQSVRCDDRLVEAIEAGFGSQPDGEDAFDAVVGLVGMLEVVLACRSGSTPQEAAVRWIEGWILGQSVPAQR